MANQKDTPPELSSLETTGAGQAGAAFNKGIIDWIVNGRPSERKSFEKEATDIGGKPVIGPDGKPIKVAVRNSQIDPKYGFKTQASPPLTADEGFYNVTQNWHPLEVVRDTIKGLPQAPQALAFLDSARRGASAGGMNTQQYRETFFPSGRLSTGAGDLNMGKISSLISPKMSDADVEKMRQQDANNYQSVASIYGIYDPKTNSITGMDWNGLARDISQHPAELASVFAGGEGAFGKLANWASKMEGVADAGTFASNLSRIKAGGFGALAKGSSAVQKGMRIASRVANPAMEPATKLVNAAISGTVSAARRLPFIQKSIYTPEFRTAWKDFSDNAVAQLQAGGNGARAMTPEEIASPEVQHMLWRQFNNQTGGRFSNPFTDEANRAFDVLERQDPNVNRSMYAQPNVGQVLDATVKNKGKGITPAILREGTIRAGAATAGPSGGPSGIGVTRSAATGEAPGWIAGRKKELSPGQTSSLEQRSRAATEGALGQDLSEAFAPPSGAAHPTHNDIANDFIDTNVRMRNEARQSYDAASRNGGIYSDPNAFLSNLDQEAASLLRQRGIDPSELQTNADAFNSANSAAANLRRNISNHGSHVPAVEQELWGNNYTYDRQHGVWVDQNGSPANSRLQYILNTDPVSQAAIASPPPQPVNRLSLDNLEIERRRLNTAADRAYQSGLANGDFRDYNAITAYRDALDNAAINMAPTMQGGDPQAAIAHLQNARSQFRQWRASGLDSRDPTIRSAAAEVVNRTNVNPQTGEYTFDNRPGARSAVAQNFEGKLVGTDRVTPSQNPASLYHELTTSGAVSNPDLVTGHVRSGYARPGASAQDVAALHNVYSGEGINLLSPSEEAFLGRNLTARGATSPTNIPERDPWSLIPEMREGASNWEKAAAIAKPLVKGGLGYLAGSAASPYLGTALGIGEMLSGPASTAGKLISEIGETQAGAPRYTPKIPSVRPFMQAGAIPEGMSDVRSNAEIDRALQAMNEGPVSQDVDRVLKGLSEEQPQTQSTGGRTAYRAGGKVSRDIEPLVRALMNKAKQAKRISNKATEPLLDAHDDAIASALATAQKAI